MATTTSLSSFKHELSYDLYEIIIIIPESANKISMYSFTEYQLSKNHLVFCVTTRKTFTTRRKHPSRDHRIHHSRRRRRALVSSNTTRPTCRLERPTSRRRR